MANILFGVGHNDADYNVTKKIDGKTIRCPYYVKWTSMLKRCYDQKWLSQYTSYVGCTVCEEWLTFSNFRNWMINQNWEGKNLDKDLLQKSNVYSPETCVFIDSKLNSYLTLSNNSRGELPIGVAINGKKYCAHISGKYIGTFDTIMEAHKAWQNEKLLQAVDYHDNADDSRVKDGLQRIINSIQYDIDHDEYTTKL